MVIDAEQFKAAVAKPTGMSQEIEQIIKSIYDNQDDNFFHLTCHVDTSLHQHIEVGLYIDLDRLLPKNHTQLMNPDQCMQFVNHEGAIFWVPVDREVKINGISKWDQAFRVYAAIYCKANPQPVGNISIP